MARKKADKDYDSIADFPGSRRIYRGKGGETQPKKGRGTWLGANAAPEDAVKGKGIDPEQVIKSRDKDVIGAPSAPINTEGLPKLESERKTPVKKFEGEYTKTELPKAAQRSRSDYKKKKQEKPEVKKDIRFAEDGGVESGTLVSSMNVPKDPEPSRTGGNRGVTGTPESGTIPPESSDAKPLIGRSNRNATVRDAQRTILETGTANEYWKHAIGTEKVDKSKGRVVTQGDAGVFSDLGGTREGRSAGGFCTNCDTSIPDVEAAIPKENKPRYVSVYGGPGKPPRQQLIGRNTKTTFEPSTRDDTLCATCTPVASSITSSGQKAISEQFRVQRPRG